ncbi:hypothetical protein VZG28_04865 [Synechococcus elongatus IITB4]|uniref:hypothetical protein n=1 Tax=Synechococcus elongatus TaxID=32046 RepID=UPI0030D1AB26
MATANTAKEITMPHQLWETKEWQSASDEEVIAALFDCPAHLARSTWRQSSATSPTASGSTTTSITVAKSLTS